jgi:hypothetical protein
MKRLRIHPNLAVTAAAVAISAAQFAWSAYALHPVACGAVLIVAALIIAVCTPALFAAADKPHVTGNDTVRINLL